MEDYEKDQRAQGAIDTTGSAIGMAGAGAAVGATMGKWGGPIGAGVGALAGMTVGIIKHAVGKKAAMPGPAGETMAQQALLRANVESIGDQMTATDLSVLAAREVAELDSAIGNTMSMSMNPNIPASSLMDSEKQATAGLRSLMLQQGAVRGIAEVQASKMQAERKLQALGNLANIAVKNSQMIQEAEAMTIAMRQASIARIGEATGAAAKGIVTALKINAGEKTDDE